MKKLCLGSMLLCSTALYAMPSIYFTYPGWVYKAVTFSFDDGGQGDRKLVEIFNRYGMKGTFNVSAGRAGSKPGFLKLSEYAELYQGHEIASHGFLHKNMAELNPEEIEQEIVQDLTELEKVANYPVRGFAYPYGKTSPEVRAALARHGIQYARGTGETGSFRETHDPMYWVMSGYSHANLPAIAAKYRDYSAWGGVLSVCSVWGHAYEFDNAGDWNVLEDFCKTLAHRPDIWYATNIEIIDYMAACRQLQVSVDGKIIVNPTAIPVYLTIDGKKVVIEPKKEVETPLVPGIVYPAGSYPVFPGGRIKALTFSYDDGVADCDRKLTALFDRCHLKGTFNVNSSRKIDYSIYRNHEIATHGVNHGSYQVNPKEFILHDVYFDRANLESAVGYVVRGNAWPNGSGWSDFPAAKEVYKACNIAYSRTTTPAQPEFSLPEDFLAWDPTAHHIQNGDLQEIGKRFLSTTQVPALCNIWGHSFEFDRANNWNVMEDFAKLVADRPEIWYATNIEICDYVQAVRALQWSCDRSFCRNMSATTICYVVNGKLYVLKPGTTTHFAK